MATKITNKMMSGLLVVSDSHTDQFKKTFTDFSSNKILTDVTLVCDDKVKIEAHRIILCAGSSMFKEFFIDNLHPHPMLYLKGVKHQILRHILEYLYEGKTKIPQKDVNSFLDLAKDLEVLGLESEGDPENSEEYINQLENSVMNHNQNKCQNCHFQGLTFHALQKHVAFMHKYDNGNSSKPSFTDNQDLETLKIELDAPDNATAVDIEEKDNENTSDEELLTFEPQTVLSKGVKSLIWKFFIFKGTLSKGALKDFVYCKSCPRETKLAYCGGTTTSLWNHMKRHHEKELKEAEIGYLPSTQSK